jgi:hypothetical protein
MHSQSLDKNAILDAIRLVAEAVGHPPSRSEFIAKSGITEYHVLEHFPSWREAVRVAGLEPNATNVEIEDRCLLEEWGEMVRRIRQIPTRSHYRREGRYSPGTFEKHFGSWPAIPAKFQDFASDKKEWQDVLTLLPVSVPRSIPKLDILTHDRSEAESVATVEAPEHRHSKLSNRQTYGSPIDFRGLRHEPTNENGVVFLFGVVARELGYMVEAVLAGFPDCEAKRQFAPGRWQRVRIEFEFESRNFRDHGHPPDGCDVIVSWRHNWTDCPEHIQVVELSTVIKSLAKSED